SLVNTIASASHFSIADLFISCKPFARPDKNITKYAIKKSTPIISEKRHLFCLISFQARNTLFTPSYKYYISLHFIVWTNYIARMNLVIKVKIYTHVIFWIIINY